MSSTDSIFVCSFVTTRLDSFYLSSLRTCSLSLTSCIRSCCDQFIAEKIIENRRGTDLFRPNRQTIGVRRVYYQGKNVTIEKKDLGQFE
jgi:hypothetical protein